MGNNKNGVNILSDTVSIHDETQAKRCVFSVCCCFCSIREDDDEIWTPRNPDGEHCAVLVRNTGKLAISRCSFRFPFFCVGDNLVLVKQNKTWEDARQHCDELVTSCEDRGLCKHGLLTLPEQRDLNYVRARLSPAETDEV